MFKSILIGLFVVMLISWGIGAYNRLVKMRAAITLAYAAWQKALAAEDGMLQSPKADLESLLLKDAYLATMTQYNQAIAQIPAAWIAALFGFKPEYFEESKH